MPSLSMDFLSDKYALVQFKADDGIVNIPQQNIPLIGALHERYTHYQEHKVKAKVFPLLPGTSTKELILVNNALNTRPDTFPSFFGQLSQEDQTMLVQSSGLFKRGASNITTMGLYVPEITKRLFAVYAIQDLYINHVKPLLNDQDDARVINYCKKQLIQSKGFFIKQPILNTFNDPFENTIDLQSLFINGSCAHNNMYPIPLYINGRQYQAYAYNFISEHCEYRVTQMPGNSLGYMIWFIDHNNATATIAAEVKHNSPLKGCCFSTTKTGTGYIVTYSETDINFSTITTLQDGSLDVKPVHLDIQNNGKIATVEYDHTANTVQVVTYEGINNMIAAWHANGTLVGAVPYPYKQYGVLEQIIITKNRFYYDELFCIFTVANMYSVHVYKRADNGGWNCKDYTQFDSKYQHPTPERYNYIIPKNDHAVVYNFWASPFRTIEHAAKKKQQSSLWQNLKDTIYFETTDECHKRYSPLGAFLLRHSLKKKSGLLYLETQIQDAVTHKPILSLDTLYANFAGVGFTHDEQELIFVNHNGFNDKVSLGLSDTDKKELKTFERMALADCGTASLLQRLSTEYDQEGSIFLDKNDPVRTMLIEFSKHPGMLKFFEICFPLGKIKS